MVGLGAAVSVCIDSAVQVDVEIKYEELDDLDDADSDSDVDAVRVCQ